MILNKIEKTHFSESEANIMRYILRSGEKIADMTTKDIAEATFTSAPLCIRIAKKLGYEGWNDFKKAFLKELEYMYSTRDVDASIPFVVSDDTSTIANNMFKLHEDTVKDTKALLTHDDLAKAVSLLRKAEVIDIYTKSTYLYLAQGFMQKMRTCFDVSGDGESIACGDCGFLFGRNAFSAECGLYGTKPADADYCDYQYLAVNFIEDGGCQLKDELTGNVEYTHWGVCDGRIGRLPL